jgi:hypothetical protein
MYITIIILVVYDAPEGVEVQELLAEEITPDIRGFSPIDDTYNNGNNDEILPIMEIEILVDPNAPINNGEEETLHQSLFICIVYLEPFLPNNVRENNDEVPITMNTGDTAAAVVENNNLSDQAHSTDQQPIPTILTEGTPKIFIS